VRSWVANAGEGAKCPGACAVVVVVEEVEEVIDGVFAEGDQAIDGGDGGSGVVVVEGAD
jgi:hypothetical protein